MTGCVSSPTTFLHRNFLSLSPLALSVCVRVCVRLFLNLHVVGVVVFYDIVFFMICSKDFAKAFLTKLEI